MTFPERYALRGDLLDFTADPGFAAPTGAQGVRYRPDHWLLVEGGRIAGVQADAPDASWAQVDHRGSLVMPGFIDTHVHSPQLDVIASYGTELLEWLNTYTFPAERRYADPEVAAAGAERFLDSLLAHGTTSAVVFPTVHKVSAEALFAGAEQRGMRLIAGKILMDRHAPDGLRDDVEQAERDCVDLVQRWHCRGRLAYALTVRFAPTSTSEQMHMAAALMKAYPGTYMQTHVAESRDEVRWVAELFPQSRSYLDVYHRHGLLNERAVLAHGIWLDDTDRVLLRETGAQIAHSPSSNLFLGSGLFDWLGAEGQGAHVTLATDVGGGTSLSMIRTLADAYKVQAMRGVKLTAYKALYGATRGAAQALHLADEIGSFDTGCHADVAVWDWTSTPLMQHRIGLAQDLHEKLFAWMTLGDERLLQAAYVAGTPRFRRA
ncbi:guanine deaminase [Roseateles asaccharophilus]|uniref:Guanine deaminase n=1 Tax=Roseateles asaccharophilus TaxID=582607 RepID=A0ABU2AE00_9BURK|nr:guanine deaminase [Roseateles asaccharophilus]MDR7334813.1 guanine deaminase [Roseateles asaccharophilus]